MLVYVGLPLHGGSLGKEKWPWRASVLIVSMVEVSVLHNRLTACACFVCVLVTYAKN